MKAEHAANANNEEGKEKKKIEVKAEREWVLPTHLGEKMSLRRFAEVMDGLSVVPPDRQGGKDVTEDEGDVDENKGEEEGKNVGDKWQGEKRQKRLLLATLHDDSTVTYYIMHDGIVKPRQN